MHLFMKNNNFFLLLLTPAVHSSNSRIQKEFGCLHIKIKRSQSFSALALFKTHPLAPKPTKTLVEYYCEAKEGQPRLIGAYSSFLLLSKSLNLFQGLFLPAEMIADLMTAGLERQINH